MVVGREGRIGCGRGDGRQSVSEVRQDGVFEQEGKVAGLGLGSRRGVQTIPKAANSLVGTSQDERVGDARVGKTQEIGCLFSKESASQTVGAADCGGAVGRIRLSDEIGEHLDDRVGDGDRVDVRAGLCAFGDFAVAEEIAFPSFEEKCVGSAQQRADIAPYLREASPRAFVHRHAEKTDVLQEPGRVVG